MNARYVVNAMLDEDDSQKKKKKQPYSPGISVHGSGWINGSDQEKVLTNRLCLGIGKKSQEEPTLTV